MSDTSVPGERSGLHAGPKGFCRSDAGQGTPEGGSADRGFRRITVIFCDMVRSVETAARLDPEINDRIMERYHYVIRNVAERHGGAGGAVVGDGVLVVFGVPTWYDDDALRAVQAAYELRQALTELDREMSERYSVTVTVRMGVHTGEALVGPKAGPEGVRGEIPNLAQRLQAAARDLDTARTQRC